MATLFHFLLSLWPLFVALLGFALGCLATRAILTPRYCPRCNYYLNWRSQTQKKEREPWESP